ncbi:MAG TPA: DUF6285 domain-containing protein [Casimicrobiaceae bacterium]|nr:DUF6285 domain-containing protein [Casimicrobiaceae bacterium]
MSDIPDASNLLATAREVVVNDLLPALPSELRHAALMIANAMAISAREYRQGEEALRAETARLRELLASAAPAATAPGARHDTDPVALRRLLVAAIRAGAFDDPPRNAALVDHLTRSSADWTAISNPKALRR